MSPSRHPKRALFSLNVDTNADHIYERIVDNSKQRKDGQSSTRVREHTEPLVGNSSVRVLTRPFEKEVQRSVERIVDGRVVRDTETSYSTEQHSHSSSSNKRKATKKKGKSVEERYDTSDL